MKRTIEQVEKRIETLLKRGNGEFSLTCKDGFTLSMKDAFLGPFNHVYTVFSDTEVYCKTHSFHEAVMCYGNTLNEHCK